METDQESEKSPPPLRSFFVQFSIETFFCSCFSRTSFGLVFRVAKLASPIWACEEYYKFLRIICVQILVFNGKTCIISANMANDVPRGLLHMIRLALKCGVGCVDLRHCKAPFWLDRFLSHEPVYSRED